MTIDEIGWCILCGLCIFIGWMQGKGYLITLTREELVEWLKLEREARRKKKDETRRSNQNS